MTTSLLRELQDDRTRLMPLTVRQYHQMIAAGIVPEGEPYELLDGQLLRKDRSATGEDPMTVSHQHAWAVKALARLGTKFEPLGCHVQTQQPITLPPHQEPEPDGAVIAGSEEDYRDRHPGPRDVLCVVEVADASLRRDRTTKLRIYASAGIGTYLIVNLRDRCVEVHTGPIRRSGRYRDVKVLAVADAIAFPAPAGKVLELPVRRLFA